MKPPADKEFSFLTPALRRSGFNNATVRSDMPSGAEGARTQRIRWEGGRLRMLREHGPLLLRKSLCGQSHALESLADLLLLPLAYHALLIAANLLLAIAGGAPTIAVIASVGLFVVVLHVLAAISVSGLPWSHLRHLARVPGYLFWKMLMLVATLTGANRQSVWIRTNRSEH